MLIELHPNFIKAFNKRIAPNPKLRKKVDEQSQLFEINPKDSRLKDHKLLGKNGDKRSFWITGDIRIIYLKKSDNCVRFPDIGTHNQVY